MCPLKLEESDLKCLGHANLLDLSRAREFPLEVAVAEACKWIAYLMPEAVPCDLIQIVLAPTAPYRGVAAITFCKGCKPLRCFDKARSMVHVTLLDASQGTAERAQFGPVHRAHEGLERINDRAIKVRPDCADFDDLHLLRGEVWAIVAGGLKIDDQDRSGGHDSWHGKSMRGGGRDESSVMAEESGIHCAY